MKTKAIILVVLMLIALPNFGQIIKNRPFKDVPYANTITTHKFIVLDINFDKQLVAFKHVFELNTTYDELGEIYEKPCNCHYTGMKDTLAGVILGVYDLKNQQYLKTFTIYKSTYNKSECYDHKTSKQKLDAAKLFFKQNGLDITKKPKPLPFVSKKLEIDGITFTYTNQIENTDSMLTVSKLFATNNKQTEIYRVNQHDSYIMASGGNTEYLAAYKQGNKIVLLSVFKYVSHMAGETDQETFQFTPVFNLSTIENTSANNQKSLYDLLWNLVESPNFHGTIKDIDYPSQLADDSYAYGYEILNKKPNDFIKLNLWGFNGQNDTVIFQLLKQQSEYKLYLFYNQGHSETPRSFYNDIYLFKLNNTRKWAEKKLLIDNYNLSYFTTYNPETKTISDFNQEPDDNTLFGAVPTNLKAQYKWSAKDEIFIKQNIEVAAINNLPNPVLIKGNIEEGSGIKSNYIIGELDENYHSTYLQSGGKKKIKIIYSYGEKSYVGDFFGEDYNKFEKEVLNNKDTSIRFFIKYKDEGNGIKTFDDYEIIGKSPVIASFDSFYIGDFLWFTFKTRLGYLYNFNEVKTEYLFDNENQNRQYIGKKFKIWYHSKMVDNEFGGGKFEYFTVDSIILLNNPSSENIQK